MSGFGCGPEVDIFQVGNFTSYNRHKAFVALFQTKMLGIFRCLVLQ